MNPLRIVQWTAGNVGRQAVLAVAQRPDLTYVGAFTRSADKVGQDLGTTLGLDPLGVQFTDDLQQLLDLRPDCVVYTPLHFNADEASALLEAGINVVTSAEFLSGFAIGPQDLARVIDAAERGGATIFGSGMNPGFAELVAGVLAGACRRVNKVTIRESFDLGAFAGDSNMDGLGFGDPIDSPDLAEQLRSHTLVFGDAVEVLAALLGVELDDIGFRAAFAGATKDLDLEGRPIAEGTVAGIDLHWLGSVADREVIDLHLRWVMGTHLSPEMPADSAYTIEIDGEPKINTRIDLLPHQEDWSKLTLADFHAIGMIITATPLINAIPAVCAAAPGLATYADLPVITGRLSPATP